MPNNYGLREVADLTFYDLTTNKPFLYVDYALTSSNAHSADTTYARGGKSNPKRLSWDGNKESTLTVSTSIFNFTLISLLSGATVTTGATNVFKREVKTVASGAITLSGAPVDGTLYVFPKDSDGVDGSELTATNTDATVTITGAADGDEVVAYYQMETTATAEKISFKSNVFPKYSKIVGDTLIKNEATGDDEDFQMIAYKAKPQVAFTLTMASEGDPTTLDITFDLFADADNNMIDYIRYDG